MGQKATSIAVPEWNIGEAQTLSWALTRKPKRDDLQKLVTTLKHIVYTLETDQSGTILLDEVLNRRVDPNTRRTQGVLYRTYFAGLGLEPRTRIVTGLSRSLRTSFFKQRYITTKTPMQQHIVFAALQDLLSYFGEKNQIQREQTFRFFNSLQAEAFQHHEELLENLSSACSRIWTSAQSIDGIELCSILNEVLREDVAEIMGSVATLCRGINLLCVASRRRISPEWPTNNTLFRGVGFPVGECGLGSFFQQDLKYRCAMYLATSTALSKAKEFCLRATRDRTKSAVMFVVHLNPEYKCCQVNYIDCSNASNEKEFLFAPYSVFTVRKVTWKTSPTWQNPHVVELEAAIDNCTESEDLPLSYWH